MRVSAIGLFSDKLKLLKPLETISKNVGRNLVEFGQEIVPGITIIEAVGHTPGHFDSGVASECGILIFY
jgi:glyoxylase-like metal-dependent hydrolase (beta-lactamase superfamily II)